MADPRLTLDTAPDVLSVAETANILGTSAEHVKRLLTEELLHRLPLIERIGIPLESVRRLLFDTAAGKHVSHEWEYQRRGGRAKAGASGS